jgi:GNAT superfamily N-acetyltransferase
MSSPSFLIDTNVLIGLEDSHQVPEAFSALINLTARHHLSVFVHEAAKDDINRDKDVARKSTTLSKIAKFQVLKKVSGLTEGDLAADFGPLPKHNDVVDSTLLHALSLNIVDFLVTEDRGLHERARKYAPALSRRIVFVADAVSLLKARFEDVEVPLRYVREVDAHTIALANPIFNSLREGYPEFDVWWQTKCVVQFRKCWVVLDPDLAGIVVRKDENRQDTDATLPGNKILKICTFKVRPESRGTKLGELLLRQVLWFAQANKYDVVYVTTFPEQAALIDMIEYYGFALTQTDEQGEMTYEKSMFHNTIGIETGQSVFETARRCYPRFCVDESVEGYGIPIKEAYHDVLFPELKRDPQLDLLTFSGTASGPTRPGNTIRKVYLCRAPKILDKPGSLLIFYKGVSKFPPSQAVTTVGVFEDMQLATTTAELTRFAGGRSVYSERQLSQWRATPERPVKVINFLLAGHIGPPLALQELQRARIFNAAPPQSIFRLTNEKLSLILSNLTYAPQD